MRVLWGSAALSDIGTWVQLIVVGSLIAADTDSAFLTGLVALATFMPQGLAAPIGGLLADRYDRRHVLAGALAVQATATTVLASLLAGGVRTPLVLSAVILVASAAGSLGGPALSAMLPDLVPPNELTEMVALTVFSWNAGRIIGPLLGAVLVATAGPAWSVAFNAITFATLAVTVLSLRGMFRPHGRPEGSVADRLRHGWMAMRRTPGCRYGVTFIVLLNLFVAPFMGLIPFYAHAVFDGGTELAGAISASQGAGAIVGGLASSMLIARIGTARVITGLAVWLVVAYLAYAAAPSAIGAAVAAGLMGAGSASFFSTSMSVVQRDAPDAERGRVMSIAQASMGTGYGFGILVVGAIADAWGPRAAFVLAAGALAVSFASVTARHASWRTAVEAPHDLVR